MTLHMLHNVRGMRVTPNPFWDISLCNYKETFCHTYKCDLPYTFRILIGG